MKILASILALFFVMTAKAQSPESWSLAACIQTAFLNSPVLQQNKLNADLSQNQLLQSRMAALPSLQTTLGQNYFWGRAIDPYTNQFSDQSSQSQSLSLNSSVTVFGGMAQRHTIKQNQFLAQATQLDIRQSQDQLSLAVLVAYLQVLSADDAIGITEKQLDLSKAQLERTSALVEAGSMAPHALLELKAQLANDELSLITAKNTKKLANLALCQVMNMPLKEINLERLSAADKFMGLYDGTKEQVEEIAIKSFSVIKAADLRIESADWGMNAAKGRMLPTVSAFGSISTRNSTTAPLDFRTQLSANLFKYLGFELSVPIFNGLQNRTRWQNAQIAQKIAKVQATGARLQLSQAIEQAYLTMQTAFSRYQGVSQQARSLEASFESTNTRFNAGNLNVLDFTIAKTNLDRAKMNLIQAQYEYIFRTKVLDFYKGIDFKNNN